MATDVVIPRPTGRPLTGALALPMRERPTTGWPGVVVLHEVFGLAPEMVEVADRFAEHGYATVVPDLFGAGQRVACLARAMVELVTRRPGPTIAAVEATRTWLSGREDVDSTRLAVIGFCMGGGFALAYAATAPEGVRATSVNYGQVPRQAQARARSCPIVGSYGGRDLVYGQQARRLEAHLDRVGVAHDVKSYPDAGHSFMTPGEHPIGKLVFFPMRVGFHEQAANDAWRRVFALFDKHVKDASSAGE